MIIFALSLQATKKMNSFADFDGDDIEMDDNDSDDDDNDSDDASDFDEDLDPDKIEVPGKAHVELKIFQIANP